MKISKFSVAMFVVVSLLTCGNVWAGPLDDRVAALEATVATLQSQVATLTSQVATLNSSPAVQMGSLGYLRLETGDLNYLKGPHIIFEGVNVHVRDGSGVTEGEWGWDEAAGMNRNAQTGYGNLVIGYNELNLNSPLNGQYPTPLDRSGTHNFIMGQQHRYRASSNILHGWKCLMNESNSAAIASNASTLNGSYAATLSGMFHELNVNSAIIGGRNGVTSGYESVIIGGDSNTAGASNSVITGGMSNTTNGSRSSISGGNSITVDTEDGWAAPGH